MHKVSEGNSKLIFDKYNHYTGEREYLKVTERIPEPERYCERCGKKKHTKLQSQGFYFYLCDECSNECFHWNGTYLEFTTTYHNEYMNRMKGLMNG